MSYPDWYWDEEKQGYSEEQPDEDNGPVCDNCGCPICAAEIPELPILCQTCGVAREMARYADFEPLPDGFELDATEDEDDLPF